ncbi:MAG: hypothetical protein NVSMB63_08200 [Sediminibacterium sp.]
MIKTNNMHKKFWVKKIIGCIGIAIAAIALISYVVMLLWNDVLTAALHVSAVNYWQAMGILVLSKILFGGFKGRGGSCRQPWKNEMKEKWHNMTPEERERIKTEWRDRCRVWKKSGEETNAGSR